MNDLITVEWCQEREQLCDDETLHELLGDGLTPFQVLDLKISPRDRVLAVCHWLPLPERMEFLKRLLHRLICQDQSIGLEVNQSAIGVFSALDAGRWPNQKEKKAVRDAVNVLRESDAHCYSSTRVAWAAARGMAAKAASQIAWISGELEVQIADLRDIISNMNK